MRRVPAIFRATDNNECAAGYHMVCQECGHDTFRLSAVILTNGDHQHVECAQCGASYCNGECSHGRSTISSDLN